MVVKSEVVVEITVVVEVNLVVDVDAVVGASDGGVSDGADVGESVKHVCGHLLVKLVILVHVLHSSQV